jgi:hypothetical protein
VQDENELMFGGSDLCLLMAYFWQSGLFFGTYLEVRNRGVLRAFLGEVSGKWGLIWAWIGGGEMI